MSGFRASPESSRQVFGPRRNQLSPGESKNVALVLESSSQLPENIHGYAAIILREAVDGRRWTVPVLHSVRAIDHLKAGYIVGIEPESGFVRTLYRPDSRHNTLFVTERCNSNCLMCSQPPVDKDDIPQLTARNLTLLDLISPAPEYLCITGGEPTLLEDNLFAIFSKLRDKMPETFVHMYQRPAFCLAGVYVELCGYQTPEFQLWHTSVLRPGGATRLRCRGQECLRPNYPS